MSVILSLTDLFVLTIGLGLVIFVVWFFFGGKKKTAAMAKNNGQTQQIEIEVVGGYSPSIISLAKDRPARLIFYRKENSSCSEEVVLADFKIRQKLPAFQKTTIEFRPEKAGEFEFTCGMGMLHGKIIVQ